MAAFLATIRFDSALFTRILKMMLLNRQHPKPKNDGQTVKIATVGQGIMVFSHVGALSQGRGVNGWSVRQG